MTLYPTRYGSRMVTIDQLFAEHHMDKMHPEFARRLRRWLIDQGGKVGIGGSWRDDGAQPDKPGFAPEGKSFHQYQKFASGLVKFAAVDLVVVNPGKIHRAPYWSEVPLQGYDWATRYGVHANVSNESWHMQPVEIDGHSSWLAAGSPDPRSGYPIPDDVETDMKYLVEPYRSYDSRIKDGELKVGEVRKIPVAMAHAAHVNVTCISENGGGWVSVAGTVGAVGKTSIMNFEKQDGRQLRSGSIPLAIPDGHLYIKASTPCHVIVDVFAVG